MFGKNYDAEIESLKLRVEGLKEENGKQWKEMEKMMKSFINFVDLSKKTTAAQAEINDGLLKRH